MINRVIIILFVAGTVGLTAFDFNKSDANCISNDLIEGDTIKKQTVATTDFLDLKFTEVIKPPLNQDLFYLVKGKYDRPTTIEILQKAKSINDVIPNYPNSWIQDYSSVEISSTCCNKKTMIAKSADNILSKEQIALFNSAEVATRIDIEVNYKNKNSVTSTIEDRQMNVSFTVIPEVEAEYIGGYDQMITYLKDKSTNEISASRLNNLDPLSILFTVNEEGNIENVKVDKTSGDNEIDRLSLKFISDMPKWKPAENSKGSSVKQQFEFLLGMDGC